MHWFSTGLLIALSAGTAGWAAWLLRRLFVVEPEPTRDGARTADLAATAPDEGGDDSDRDDSDRDRDDSDDREEQIP